MKKKLLIIGIVVIGVVAFGYYCFSSGIIKLETAVAGADEEKTIISVDDLEDGNYYVWHNDAAVDISSDLNGTVDADVFRICPEGDVNWKKDSAIAHTLWFTSTNDVEIPTLYPGDELLYISSTYVPVEGISWERFADYGYTIGVANMVSDYSGHYYIVNSGDKNGYFGYVYDNSDAVSLESFQSVSYLFLDKIGSVQVLEDLISDGGTIMGLEKDKTYICEWYTGTYYQDFEMSANVHAFGSLESFITYDYEFLHSNCIAITIPAWLKTGYYYIDEIGFFRYVSESDAAVYNGEAYDADIDWNDPIILYNENGTVKYNPSLTDSTSNGTESAIDESTTDSQIVQVEETDEGTDNEETEPNEDAATKNGDAGAEEYENIDGEIINE